MKKEANKSADTRKLGLITRLKGAYEADPLFRSNEVAANRLQTLVLMLAGLFLILADVAVELDIFEISKEFMRPAAMQGILEIVALCVVVRIVRGDTWWLKYLLLIGTTLIFARVDMLFTHKTHLVMAIPVICSCRYYSKRLTVGMSVLTAGVFAVSAAIGANAGLLDMNDLTLPVGTTLTTTDRFVASGLEAVGYDHALQVRNVLLFSYAPKWMIFCVISVVCVRIAVRGREMVETEKAMTENSARIETELNLAAKIQADMLPGDFPPFPDRREFDIYAMMDPAKEVGGDFYDFFFIDRDHLALAIADVSGKGVPAALFMMMSKILVQNSAMSGISPAKVLEAVNQQLCANNQEQMFLTIWLGVLDLRNGHLTAANAGHEYPVLRSPGGRFEMYKDRHGLVIGAMEGIRYQEYEMDMLPGSKLFVYTDGVPEATDAQEELFGTTRMIGALNASPDASVREVLENVENAVGSFVGKAPQFDDMTMLCIEYHGPAEEVE